MKNIPSEVEFDRLYLTTFFKRLIIDYDVIFKIENEKDLVTICNRLASFFILEFGRIDTTLPIDNKIDLLKWIAKKLKELKV